MRVTGFPGWTHLLAAVAFSVCFIGAQAHAFGIDTDDWWPRENWGLVFLIVVVLLPLVLPAVVFEALVILRARRRWPARCVVIGYALTAGCVFFYLAAATRVAGDPARGDLLAAGLASFIVLMAGQALVTYALCEWWLRHAAKRKSRSSA